MTAERKTGISDELLAAYADGELDEVSRRRVERAAAKDSEVAERLEAHQKLRETLTRHYAPVAEEAVPERFRMLIGGGAEAVVASPSVIDFGAARQERAKRAEGLLAGRKGLWASLGAVAASLVIGLVVGQFFMGQGMIDGPANGVILRDGQMVASGQLASALDSGLASDGVNGPVSIGLTFRAQSGEWCRSFGGGAQGVACRSGKGWRVEQLLPGSGAESGYRQASSGDPRIAATIEALGGSAPVDAAGEKVARANGWQN